MALVLTAPLVLAAPTVSAMVAEISPTPAGTPCVYVDPGHMPEVVYVDADC